MPIDIECAETGVATLDDFKQAFADSKVDIGDQESLFDVIKPFKMLANNKSFIADLIHERISASLRTGDAPELSVHTMIIGRLDEFHYLRAVIWPAEEDDSYARTGGDIFYYGMPHDHNFHFLTAGYFGPGYRSDYYEVEDDTTGWHPGTKVALKSIGRKSLEPDTLMLYRAYVDVHSQLPPISTSISLNLMANPPPGSMPNQHVFNDEADQVAAIMQSRASPTIFSTVASILGDKCRDALLSVAERHPDPLVAFYALRALALAAPDEQGRADMFKRGLDHRYEMIRGWSRQYLEIADRYR